jgi:hypothetical protein
MKEAHLQLATLLAEAHALDFARLHRIDELAVAPLVALG